MSEREIACEDLNLAIDELKRQGFRLDLIYPADDPQSAALSRADETVHLATARATPLPDGLPPFEPQFVLTRAGASAGPGRAGMHYRDLIHGRLGGRYIASHIAIPEGGPVADWVHFHRIALQLIYVRSGWVRVVYEGEGEPFVMRAGDLVLQPPLIRHRVLESSPELEVVEISAPARHPTFADHAMALPGERRRDRDFGGQRFLRHVAADTPWTPFDQAEAQETAIAEATRGIAQVRTIRRAGVADLAFEPHEGELVFGFVLEGSAKLDRAESSLGPEDAFVIPPGEPWRLTEMSENFRLLHVTTARLDAGA